MSDPTEPLVQTCESCGALIDVSDEVPFAMMHCPTCGTGMRVRRAFDHFDLQEILGAGGMGAVYRALDTNLNRLVALKLLRKEYSENPEFVAQFQHEAAVTASINHPNVIKVYSFGEDHGLLYIAMELVDKGSLDDLMTVQGRVPEMQVLEVGIQIARGLNAALQRGLIHRDIKPGNILFADAHTAKIVDFGLAALVEDAGQIGGEVWGTPYYVAPEKLDNQPEDFRSDIYSLGATLFHAVAGRPPFEADTPSMVALKHVKSKNVSLQAFAPDVSSATAFVINKTLHKDPNQRYQSYEELIQHLEYARNQLIAQANAARKKQVLVVDDSGGAAMTWFTLVTVALMIVGGVFYYKWRKEHPSDDGPSMTMEDRMKLITDAEPLIRTARLQILSGRYSEAAANFAKIDSVAGFPQPLRNWATMHKGLAEFLAGKDKDARATFAELEKRGPFSKAEADEKLAAFFVNSGKMLASEEAVPSTIAKDLDKGSYEAFTLLIAAVKDWNMEKFDEAGPLFRQFTSSSIDAPISWLGEEKELDKLKEMAMKFGEDQINYQSAATALETARSSPPEKQKELIDRAKEARKQMKVAAKLQKIIDDGIAEIEPKMIAALAEKARMAAEDEAADTKTMQEARDKRKELIAQYKFNESRLAVTAALIRSDKYRDEQDNLGKKSQWLANFKSLLIGDINTQSFPKALQKKAGGAVEGGVVRADEEACYVKSGAALTTVPWIEISPEMVIEMAEYFIDPSLPPELAAHRQWHLGVFKSAFGKKEDARKLLVAAAKVKSEFNDELPLFLDPDKQ